MFGSTITRRRVRQMSDQRYLVSARKYRPKLFGDLMAQEHVTQTLQNALRLDKLAHAYLFSGPRGVGKTTTARILAKTINCEAGAREPEPCLKCASCIDFETGRSLSIFEIDAASHNKVEDIRDLQQTVLVPPQSGRKKVYIVDEVHMLSKAAFNALLKTLEEPPPHILFIFATTEPHKVLPTILSRCQRFDFRRIPVQDIVVFLRKICTDESITADSESLLLLARKGDGALRDALSAFDQALALCGTRLEYTALAKAMSVVDIELFFEVTTHASNRNSAGMLRLVDTLLRAGHDIQEFLGGLAEHLRNLFVALCLHDPALIEASDTTRQRYMEASVSFNEPTLLRLMIAVEEAQRTINTVAHARLRLELTLLKMARMHDALDLADTLERVDELIRRADGHRLPASYTDPATPHRKPPARERKRDSRTGSDRPGPPPPSKAAAERRRSARPPVKLAVSPGLAPGDTVLNKTRRPEPAPEVPKSVTISDEELRTDLWPEIVKHMRKTRPVIGAILEQSKPSLLDRGVLSIAVPDEYALKEVQTCSPELVRLFAELCDLNLKSIDFKVTPELRDIGSFDPGKRLRERVANEPVVRTLVDRFSLETSW